MHVKQVQTKKAEDAHTSQWRARGHQQSRTIWNNCGKYWQINRKKSLLLRRDTVNNEEQVREMETRKREHRQLESRKEEVEQLQEQLRQQAKRPTESTYQTTTPKVKLKKNGKTSII